MSSLQISVADVLCEFFEVIFHNILYVRKLYPETIFVTKRKYGVVVYQSIQPDVNEYINKCLKAVNFHAKNNRLKKVFICFEAEGKIVEKYVFDVLKLLNYVENDSFLVDLEQALRDFILKLHASQTYLNDLPGDSSFSLRIHTTTYSSLEFNQDPAFEDFPWIELRDTEENSINIADIVPLYAIKTPFLSLQMFIEKETK